MRFEQMQDKMSEAFQELMEEEGLEQLTDEQMARWPLDRRAMPYRMHANEHMLCVPAPSCRSLDYYGGFEYVGDDHRMQVGNWIIYSTEDSSVRQVVERMLDTESEEEHDEE